MKFLFSSGETRDDHKQAESFETRNTSEQPETFLKTSIADCQGSFTMKPLDK